MYTHKYLDRTIGQNWDTSKGEDGGSGDGGGGLGGGVSLRLIFTESTPRPGHFI